MPDGALCTCVVAESGLQEKAELEVFQYIIRLVWYETGLSKRDFSTGSALCIITASFQCPFRQSFRKCS